MSDFDISDIDLGSVDGPEFDVEDLGKPAQLALWLARSPFEVAESEGYRVRDLAKTTVVERFDGEKGKVAIVAEFRSGRLEHASSLQDVADAKRD